MKRVNSLQRVTNCLIIDGNYVLLLKKPRYGWYAMPGGKMEYSESVKEAVIREVYEETGLQIKSPELCSVATMTKESASHPKDEWMMFTFKTKHFSGQMIEKSPEGILEWIHIDQLSTIPTAPSDRFIHDYVFKKEQPLYASFDLDSKDQLIDYRLG
ncbi:8-oxo-dGTP diphosphatase [Pelagirhabdus alkalitolerans]|uniref:8-oxo-dGTP diphosphatase n=1 Tax=Pelagirhabdus alkalitolerans TaxID=1612202 RepID=A0A1G6NDL3_9BACI|nr:8-oxo-dGTP diphosphatase [Pelagirhabdus alkalitolerans]SDC65888.1 8-oxo-dGTP diphosphatase [Pelagirhabdus alkalitolerans]